MQVIYLSSTADASAQLQLVNERFANIFRYLEQITATREGRDFDEESIQSYHFIIYESSVKGIQDYLEFLKKKVRELYRNERTRIRSCRSPCMLKVRRSIRIGLGG